jgi:cytochrome c peroxidase
LVFIAACVAPALGFQASSPNRHATTNGAQQPHDSMEDRRAFLLSSGAFTTVAAFTSFFSSPTLPAYAASSSTVDFKAVADDIKNLVKEDPDKGPTLVRLAWHSSGTYDKMTKTGGSGEGTIRFKEELAHGGNAGLGDTAVKWMEPIHAKYDGLSYSDLYTLGGVAAIQAMGGPTIPWSSGRVDALDASAVTPDGRLPNADSGPPGADPDDAAHLRAIFNRMGFNDQEIVALSGAHALGRCHP